MKFGFKYKKIAIFCAMMTAAALIIAVPQITSQVGNEPILPIAVIISGIMTFAVPYLIIASLYKLFRKIFNRK